MMCTVFVTKLQKALRNDFDSGQLDLQNGIFGVHVSEFVREVVEELETQNQKIDKLILGN